MMARRYRPRKEFKFQLYRDVEAEEKLIEYIDYLRKTRQFVTAVRNGLRLMWTLGQGDLSVLFELFPTLRAQFAPDNTALIEEFRQLLQQNRAEAVHVTPGPKLLNAPKLTVPLVDEDQNTIVLKRTANGDAAMNFFDALLEL
jgi:hypothetical protein